MLIISPLRKNVHYDRRPWVDDVIFTEKRTGQWTRAAADQLNGFWGDANKCFWILLKQAHASNCIAHKYS